MFEIICIISGVLNIIWKYKMSGIKEVKSSWFYSSLDAALAAGICYHLKMYQLSAFEGFFAIVSILKLSDYIKGMHLLVIGLMTVLIFILNTINPLTQIELGSVVLFVLFIYFMMNKQKSLSFLFLAIGNIGLIYILYEKGTYVFLVFQIISLFLAIRGVINHYPKKSRVTHL